VTAVVTVQVVQTGEEPDRLNVVTRNWTPTRTRAVTNTNIVTLFRVYLCTYCVVFKNVLTCILVVACWIRVTEKKTNFMVSVNRCFIKELIHSASPYLTITMQLQPLSRYFMPYFSSLLLTSNPEVRPVYRHLPTKVHGVTIQSCRLK
jgi:hypothetical protein